MKPRQFRLYLLLGTLALLAIALGLSLYAAKDGVMYYRTPSQIYQDAGNPSNIAELVKRKVRLGGLVQVDSYYHDTTTGWHSFRVTDGKSVIQVKYQGILPALFAEGQGVVVDGVLNPAEIYPMGFNASRVLAKHDENYRPPQIPEEAMEDRP